MSNQRCGHRRSRSQSGFTLLELLVVVAVLAVLAGVAVFAVSNITENAQVRALDVSLHNVGLATDAAVIANGVSYREGFDTALAGVKAGSKVEFTVSAETADTFVVQARPEGATEPCRETDLMGSGPRDCGGAQAPASTTSVPPTTTPTPSTAPPTTAPHVPELSQSVTALRTERFSWWNWYWDNTGGDGAWAAQFTFENTWMRQQYLDLEITRHRTNGTTEVSTQNRFYVPGRGTSPLTVWNNDFRVLGASGTGVESVTVRVVRVVGVTEDWKEVTGDGTGSATATRPTPTR